MLTVFVIFALLISALEAMYYFALAMLFWALPLGAAFAAAFAMATARPADPLAPFYAFLVVALAGRLALSLLSAALQHMAKR